MGWFGVKRPNNCGPGRNRAMWIDWSNDLYIKTEEYLKSDNAWKHDFSKEPSEEGFDCEASHLAKCVFELFLDAEGYPVRNPQTSWQEGDGRIGQDRSLRIENRPANEKGFFFDVMNNPNTGDLAYAWHGSGVVPEFKSMYHKIGNFGLLPEWLRGSDQSLQLVHKHKNERWDAFMQYELIPRFESMSPSGHIDFTRYIELNCAYQYVLGCPKLEEGWEGDSKFDWKAQVEEWKGWLRRESSRHNIKIAPFDDCGRGEKAMDDSWDSENKRFKKLYESDNAIACAKMDDWICDLIEVRGRCILAIASAQLQ